MSTDYNNNFNVAMPVLSNNSNDEADSYANKTTNTAAHFFPQDLIQAPIERTQQKSTYTSRSKSNAHPRQSKTIREQIVQKNIKIERVAKLGGNFGRNNFVQGETTAADLREDTIKSGDMVPDMTS